MDNGGANVNLIQRLGQFLGCKKVGRNLKWPAQVTDLTCVAGQDHEQHS
jgi:hypothetical protein